MRPAQIISGKNYDLPKVGKRGKTVNFNFLKTANDYNCKKLSKVTSNFLGFHGFRNRERERERKKERENYFLIRKFVHS